MTLPFIDTSSPSGPPKPAHGINLRALLEEIERDGFRVLAQRTSLTPLRKLWIAWRTWISA